MSIYKAMQHRHAVRLYENRPLEKDIVLKLENEIENCNQEGALAIQLIINDHCAVKGLLAHFGGFRGVTNYIALISNSKDASVEKVGYYGERLALYAQSIGLNTCWIGVTYKKGKCKVHVNDGQQLVCILAVGYGTSQGVPHTSKDMAQLCRVDKEMPTWFKKGMDAVVLAPTAQNKQNFLVVLENNKVRYEIKQNKFSEIDLGIIKYHFQIGSENI